MTRKQAKEHIKDQLEAYLQGKMIDTSKLFRCLNPDHEDKNPSMGYNPDSKRVHCFSCGVTYDTLDVVGIDYGITSFNEKLQTASEIFNICLEGEDQPRIERIPEQIRKERKPKQHEKLQQDQNEYLAIAHNRIAQTAYPQQRGLSQETIDRFKLGYDPAFKTGGTTWQALIIPTSPTSYTVRNTDPTARKEDRIRKTGKSHLFNLEALEAGQPVFIVEGEIDAMSIVEAGGQAIGLGSTMNYQKLVKYLGAFPPDSPVLLALDNDKAGEETTEKLTIELDKLGVPFFKVDILGGYNNPDGYKDPNEALQKDREAFIEKIRQTELVQEEELRKEREEYHRNSAAGSIDSFINGIHARANTPSITTGFTELDNVLDGGLYEGLYIVGAISSLGKTTLITQIGDQIAQNKQDILLFSLEMAKTEIMAKSISRQTFLNCQADKLHKSNAKTTRGITDGKRWKKYNQTETDILYKSAVDYGGYATRIFIHEGIGNIGVEEIRKTVGIHKRVTGNSPVVIIDYLQILAPYNERATDKQNTDKAVLELKRISRDYKIPVIGISSFNRQSYKDAVTMEAFKESGAIEYSSDVLIGLQLEGVGGDKFDVDEEKQKDPRRVQLKILKNRNGRSGDTLTYDYYPAFNYFKEA